MSSLPYIVFSAEYMVKHYGGKFIIQNNILYFENEIDEFYCDLNNKTNSNKWRFWHKYKGQEEYHRQIDRKNIVAGLYMCFTHKNKYNGIPYNRQERIKIQRTVSEEWQSKLKNERRFYE